MPYTRFARSAMGLALAFSLACGDDTSPVTDAGTDSGPGPREHPMPTTDHCSYTALPPTAGAGGVVTAGTLSAGAAERRISIPIGATLGAYTSRSANFGGDGRIDGRHTSFGGSFAPSVGIETWPMVRAIALTTGAHSDERPAGDETILVVKAELGVAYQGLLHELEARLGPAFSGKILFAVSHSHASLANYTGHKAMGIGFGAFHRTAYDALLRDMEEAAREALANRRPARIGVAYDGEFDLADRVTRDRRDENDELAGGSFDDHHLFVIRVDGVDDEPIAVLPVFGMHGTVLGADNMLASGDAPGGVERVLEDEFDHRVVIAHLQGAGGDVAPAGDRTTDCDDAGPLCHDYARSELVGWNARAAILDAWRRAGETMQETIELEMVSRSVHRGPNAERFRVRDGELEYLPWDLNRLADGVVWEDPDTRTRLVSPIDEFNAPFGAALCNAGISLPQTTIPGVEGLRDTPYPSCLMLHVAAPIFERVLQVELGQTPLCDTTRTTISAARIGDFVLATLPGEPVTLLADRLRSLSPVAPERTIVVGYAQDHGGYMLTAEDWVRGGYEPNITFWGPLEGEAIMEEVAAILPLVLTPEREDATAGGTTRVEVPVMDDAMEPDPAPLAGTVPETLPESLLVRRGRPTGAQPTDVARLESATFTWIGTDAVAGTPRVVIERETEPGTFEPVRRASGREVADGAILLVYTPDPVETSGPHTHYWHAEWQAVGWEDARTGEAPLLPRLGAPAGRYRFHVYGPPTPGTGAPRYELTSDPFEVRPLTLFVERVGADITLRVHAPEGYRLLDTVVGANRPVPLRHAELTMTVDGGEPTAVVLDGEGRATLSLPDGWSIAELVDAYGNRAALAP